MAKHKQQVGARRTYRYSPYMNHVPEFLTIRLRPSRPDPCADLYAYGSPWHRGGSSPYRRKTRRELRRRRLVLLRRKLHVYHEMRRRGRI